MKIECADVPVLTARAVSGNADPREEEALREHLTLCASCQERDVRIRKVWHLMGRLPVPARDARSSRAASRLLRMGVPASPTGLGSRRGAWMAGLAAAAILFGIVAGSAFLSGPGPSDGLKTFPATGETAARPVPEPAREETDEAHRVEQILVDAVREQEIRTRVPAVPPPVTPAPADRPTAPERPTTPAAPSHPPEPPPAVPTPAPFEPPPAPERPAAPPEKPLTRPAVAALARVEGDVFLLSPEGRRRASQGQEIPEGAGLATAANGSQAVVEYPDGTRLALGVETRLAFPPNAARRIEVHEGTVAAYVTRQPEGAEATFVTPHAEARVLGTRLTLRVTPASTRLDVKEGRVRLSRREDGASVEVGAGQYAVAGRGVSLTARSLPAPRPALKEGFERRNLGNLWTAGSEPSASGLKFSNDGGVLSLRVPRRPPAPISSLPPAGPESGRKPSENPLRRVDAAGAWARAAWMESRPSFALNNETPLRIRLRLWRSGDDPGLSAWIALNRGVPGQAVLLERRGDLLRLWKEGRAEPIWSAEAPARQEWETLEIWVSRERLVIRRNDRAAYAGDFPSSARTVQMALGGAARAEILQDEEIRFDDVEAAWVTPADLEEAAK
jgi:ferric-dicitrate binding protein FerR (iron transport regulator)